MKAAILAALIAASSAAWADVDRVGIHLGTKHAPGSGYQDFNPGAYIVWQSGATLGAYRNSEGAGSVYAGWTWERGPFGLSAFAVTGYRRGAVVPGLVPSVRLPLGEKTGARISYILAPEKRDRAVHLSVEFDL